MLMLNSMFTAMDRRGATRPIPSREMERRRGYNEMAAVNQKSDELSGRSRKRCDHRTTHPIRFVQPISILNSSVSRELWNLNWEIYATRPSILKIVVLCGRR